MLYSADDHELLLSIRNQHWIVKIDFMDATGTGEVLWRLGEGGDFKLTDGVDPTDWFYAQHGMNFFSPIGAVHSNWGCWTTATIVNLRQVRPAAPRALRRAHIPAVAVLLVDEAAMTTLLHHYIAPASFCSFFSGHADLLPSGDIEADFCAAKGGAIVQEIQPGAGVTETAPALVWQAVSPGYDQYRSMRSPILYPGEAQLFVENCDQ